MPILTCACGTPLRYIAEEVGQGLRCPGCARVASIPDSNNAIATDPSKPTTWGSDLPKRGRLPIPWVERYVWGLLGLTVLYFVLMVVGPDGLSQGFTPSRIDIVRSQLRTIQSAVEEYREAHGELPASLALLLKCDGKRPPYFNDARALTDPWGNTFLYEVTPDGPLIGCKTPDGQIITTRPQQLPNF